MLITSAVLLGLALNCGRIPSNSTQVQPHSATQSPQQLQTGAQSPPSAQPAPPAVPVDLSPEVAEIARDAQAGKAHAMYLLGLAYATGSGAPKNYKEALYWYQKAAAHGNADAMYALGEAYEHGAGVREDVQQAVHWYDEATLRGNKAAKAALDRLGESFDR